MTDNIKTKLIFLCGSGGVGKTSISASLALWGALKGKDILVLTIDPAKRLADTMGIEITGNKIKEISQIDGKIIKGSLKVSMLDVELTAYELLKRYSPDKLTFNDLKSNLIVRTVANSLIGAEEYIALGKLFMFLEDQIADYIVVDTAPTHYALNFFQGPEKILKLFDPQILNRIINPLKNFRFGSSFKPQSKIGKLINQTIKYVFGIGLLNEIGNLVSLLNSMFDDFKKRVKKMHSILLDTHKTDIILVTSPEYNNLKEAETILTSLKSSNIQIKSVIVNRYYPFKSELTKAQCEQLKTKFNKHPNRSLLESILNASLEISRRRNIQNKFISSLKNNFNSDTKLIKIPDFSFDYLSLSNLDIFHDYFENNLEFIFSE